MDRYPKLICTCEDAGIYVLGAGQNPMAEVRRLDTGETVGYGPMQLMSIVAHIDLGEWTEEPGAAMPQHSNEYPLSDEDRDRIQQQMLGLLRVHRKTIRDRYGGRPSEQSLLEFIFDRRYWESMKLPERLDQGFRHLIREEQLKMLEPLLEEIADP